jgi:hypothetical protein
MVQNSEEAIHIFTLPNRDPHILQVKLGLWYIPTVVAMLVCPT